ncbi:UDP-glucose 4-epimerase [Pseudidiomarina piscicola]|uniref:UDP-glucose 4-epimerase n=1 Tax=Pseudidiomarina piscicola TaxID=2614830 RepID=A0A6S6WQF9_9GAMM|nr:UDP-glucose 4-epimerase [Pseudidiomarina piscicola]VZT40733.1 UDP-glucose 4-epimerase [Pseudomonas aeruginosa]
MILVTGGADYIGSHTVVELLAAGHEVLVLDDLSNSVRESLVRVEQITGKQVPFVEGNIADRALLIEIFSKHDISAVIHFAGFKAVGESVQEPLMYYQNNFSGTATVAAGQARTRSMSYLD